MAPYKLDGRYYLSFTIKLGMQLTSTPTRSKKSKFPKRQISDPVETLAHLDSKALSPYK